MDDKKIEIFKSLFSQENVLTKYSLDSYNHFIETILPKLLKDDLRQNKFTSNPEKLDINIPENVVKLHHEFTYVKFSFEKPTVMVNKKPKQYYPIEAVAKDINYSGKLNLTINYKIYFEFRDGTIDEKPFIEHEFDVKFADLPVMVKSKLCNLYGMNSYEMGLIGEDFYDPGGYFVINGNEKVIVNQERVVQNFPRVLEEKKKTLTENQQVASNISNKTFTCEIHARKDNEFDTIYITKIIYSEKLQNFFVQCNPIKPNYFIPISIVFKLLGIGNDLDIMSMIIGKDLISESTELSDLEIAMVEKYIKPALTGRKQLNKLQPDLPEFQSYENIEKYFVDHSSIGKQHQILDDSERRIKIIETFKTRFFPNVSGDYEKAVNFGYFVLRRMMISMLTKYEIMDRDSFAFKRLETSGTLVAQLIKQILDQIASFVKDAILRKKITEVNIGSKKIKGKKQDEPKEELLDFVEEEPLKKPREKEEPKPTKKKRISKKSKVEAPIEVEEDTNKFSPKMIKDFISIRLNKNNLGTAFNTGTWTTYNIQGQQVRKGVTAILERMSYLYSLSDRRRVTAVTGVSTAKTKNSTMRNLHPTHIGYLCMVETPEGDKIGILKNLALSAYVSVSTSKRPIKEFILGSGLGFTKINDTIPTTFASNYSVLINYRIYGFIPSHNVGKFMKYLLAGRRSGKIEIHTGIVFDWLFSEIRINCDTGRLTRPLIIVEDGKSRFTDEVYRALTTKEITLQDLFTSEKYHCLEYVDIEEAYYMALIAEHRELIGKDKLINHTHEEISSELLLGVCAAISPAFEFNPPVRMLFAAGHIKQSSSFMSHNYHLKLINERKILTAPNMPIVSTTSSELIGNSKFGSGQTIMIAVMSYTGFNQEDSIIMNKGAIDRGILTSAIYKVYKQEIGNNDEVQIPDKENTRNMQLDYFYRNLDPSGKINIGSEVNFNDVLIGIVSEDKQQTGRTRFVDVSLKYPRKTPGIVTDIISLTNAEKNVVYKIIVKETRPPVIGDKFSSTAGQKGTLSLVLKEEDMPFTSDGLRPDIIMNPNAFPKRMTAGMIVEMAIGLVAVNTGTRINFSPFNGTSIYTIINLLKNLGLDSMGSRTFYSGLTGEKIESEIFMAPCYYRRLKHMVLDKIQARSTGGTQVLTRQPPEGASNNGGLRLGPSEKDAIIAYGASNVVKNQFMDNSDGSEFYYCNKCGYPAIANNSTKEYYCRQCKNSLIVKVKMPYCLKLFQQYLYASMYGMRIKT